MEATITRQEVSDFIKSLFGLYEELETPNGVLEETILSEGFPSMDSLDKVELIMDIEEHYDIMFPDEEICVAKKHNEDYSYGLKFVTVGELVDYTFAKLKDQLAANKNELNLEQ